MICTQRAVELVKRYEGLATKAYRCPAGVLTIGYGHTKNVQANDVITERAATRLLENDLRNVSINITSALNAAEIHITQNQFDALCSFAFNVGVSALIKSTLWKRLESGNLTAAADQFLRWNKAKNADGEYIELKGLTRRREAERALFLSDD